LMRHRRCASLLYSADPFTLFRYHSFSVNAVIILPCKDLHESPRSHWTVVRLLLDAASPMQFCPARILAGHLFCLGHHTRLYLIDRSHVLVSNKWPECHVTNFWPVRKYFHHFTLSSSTTFFSTAVHHTTIHIPSFEPDSSNL
jgi:hypothetical protein